MRILSCPFCKKTIVISKKQMRKPIAIKMWRTKTEKPVGNYQLANRYYDSFGCLGGEGRDFARKYIFLYNKYNKRK